MKRYPEPRGREGIERMSCQETIYNKLGEKVGTAVWSGKWSLPVEGGLRCGIMIGWDCYNLSDHHVGEAPTIMMARDLLNGF